MRNEFFLSVKIFSAIFVVAGIFYWLQSLAVLIFLSAATAFIFFFLFRRTSNQLSESLISTEKNADELKKNYAELSDEKNKLTYILNNIGDGLFVADDGGNISLVNAAACEIFGASQNVTGKKLNYLVSDKDLAAMINDCVENSRNALFEFALGGKTYLVTAKRLPDTNLTMVALVDITQSRENAKRREEFFANASHELKTPLTAIKGFNELAALNNRDEQLKKYIEGITRETKRMASLIGGMLKLSELESTQEVTNPTPVSLASIINEVKDAVAIEEKNIIFEATGDAEILCEPGHLYEIVKNLIENAVRYNKIGGKVTVTVDSKKRLTVSDNGIGISPHEQTKIFERFYRVEKSRAAKSGGTGLGLSIVKHICALYGWKISLKSKLGIGTDVSIGF
jgi:two-component system phosphate regulon sensor histidine kinase PhoR